MTGDYTGRVYSDTGGFITISKADDNRKYGINLLTFQAFRRIAWNVVERAVLLVEGKHIQLAYGRFSGLRDDKSAVGFQLDGEILCRRRPTAIF